MTRRLLQLYPYAFIHTHRKYLSNNLQRQETILENFKTTIKTSKTTTLMTKVMYLWSQLTRMAQLNITAYHVGLRINLSASISIGASKHTIMTLLIPICNKTVVLSLGCQRRNKSRNLQNNVASTSLNLSWKRRRKLIKTNSIFCSVAVTSVSEFPCLFK